MVGLLTTIAAIAIAAVTIFKIYDDNYRGPRGGGTAVVCG